MRATATESPMMSEVIEKPWGNYVIVGNGSHFQVKIITINPNCRLSLQKHHFRSEQWHIVEGVASVQLGDVLFTAKAGHQIYVPKNEIHRIGATDSKVVFVEIQSGPYYGEDDITRIEDDYGR